MSSTLKAALVLSLVAMVTSSSGCSQGDTSDVQMVEYEDPQGRFRLMLPADWEIAPEESSYRLFAGKPSASMKRRFDATVGVTWGPLPCDAMLVDDALAWYADKATAGEGYEEVSREERMVDGGRALQTGFVVHLPVGSQSCGVTMWVQGYGVVWQVTCISEDCSMYELHEAVFKRIMNSLELQGAWSPVG